MHEGDSGVIELVGGLYLLAGYPDHSRSIPGYAGCSVYLVRGASGGHVLIDTGFGRFTDRIAELVRSVGIDPGDVAMVAYTHSHADHAESYEEYQRRGAKVAIHESARNAQEWGGVPVRADVFFSDGDAVEAAGVRLQVHHTPGHTPDSSSFVAEISGRRVLFVGDMAGWFFPGRGSDYRQMVASVEKVRSLGADFVCGGHWIVGQDLPTYWEKLTGSVAAGIFSLVDGCGAREHCRETGRRFLALDAENRGAQGSTGTIAHPTSS